MVKQENLGSNYSQITYLSREKFQWVRHEKFVDYDLNSGIEEGKAKNYITGRNRQNVTVSVRSNPDLHAAVSAEIG